MAPSKCFSPASHEFNIGESLGQTDHTFLGESSHVLDHELASQGPVMLGLVGTVILIHVELVGTHSVGFLGPLNGVGGWMEEQSC